MSRIWTLKVGLLAGLLLAAVTAARWTPWVGRLSDSVQGFNRNRLIDLGTAPLWDPPPPPSYEAFRAEFGPRPSPPGDPPPPAPPAEGDPFGPLPPELPAGSTISVQPRWPGLALQMGLFFWVPCAACGALYLWLRRGRRDFLLHVATGAAVVGAPAVVSLPCLWGAAGFFVWCGLLAGALAGAVLYLSSRARSTG